MIVTENGTVANPSNFLGGHTTVDLEDFILYMNLCKNKFFSQNEDLRELSFYYIVTYKVWKLKMKRT